jgi:hypothetical protein
MMSEIVGAFDAGDSGLAMGERRKKSNKPPGQ